MVGQEILNYVIIRKIGEGGMGQVFLARNKSIHQFVAIKMLHPRFSRNPELLERFRQEAIMLSSLDHQNIVKFLNYVENAQGVFLIMEYVDGMTLEDFINMKNGLVVEERAYSMMLPVIDAFSYAHGRGIVHRDIKPGNILIGRDGTVKVLDFGIAQIVSESDDCGLRGGTVSYMSPEQTLDRPLDIRSDIYSLGVVFYQMLTGRPPYDLSCLSAFEIKRSIQDQPLPPMRKVYPYISDGIQGVVDKATAKNPDSRYRNCGELRAAVCKARSEASGPAEKDAGVRKGLRWLVWTVLSLVSVCAVSGLWWWMYDRVTVRYYADYTEAWEIPEGIGRLSAEEAHERGSAYRMESSRGLVRRISHIGTCDSVVAVTDSFLALVRFPDVEYIYGADGSVARKNVYGPDEKLMFAMTYSPGHGDAVLEYAPSSGSTAGVSDSTVSVCCKLHYDAGSGHRVDVLMVDREGRPDCGPDSVYGYLYSYDRKGRINRLAYLGPDGKARANRAGIAYVRYDFTEDGLLAQAACYDGDGRPVAHPEDVSAGVSSGTGGDGVLRKPGGKRAKKSSRKSRTSGSRIEKKKLITE